MKATAISPANIAFIKYWGRKDHKLFLPLSTTNSMNLSSCKAVTTIEFGDYTEDTITVITRDGEKKELNKNEGDKTEGLFTALDRVRARSGVKSHARVVSKLTFPFKAGVASSAAGISALVAAAYKAVGMKEVYADLKELSREVRLAGSPSAARSVADGYTQLLYGETHEKSYVEQIAPASHWDLFDIIPVITKSEKKISTSKGHELAATSPFYKARITYLQDKPELVKQAILDRDFNKLALLSETDAINMHAIMMTSQPMALYFEPLSITFIRKVQEWRENGLEVFYTFDAGPNPHLITTSSSRQQVVKLLKEINGVEYVIENQVGEGLRFDDSQATF